MSIIGWVLLSPLVILLALFMLNIGLLLYKEGPIEAVVIILGLVGLVMVLRGHQ